MVCLKLKTQKKEVSTRFKIGVSVLPYKAVSRLLPSRYLWDTYGSTMWDVQVKEAKAQEGIK